MNRFIIFTGFILFYISLSAQVTTLLTTQAQIDYFAANITSVDALQIGSAIEMSDITDLSPLSGLKYIHHGGLAIVNNPLLTSLLGLQNLVKINGLVWIQNNDSLVNLTGLPDTYYYGDISEDYKGIKIINNDMMTDLTGFPYVEDIHIIIIAQNDNLESLQELIQYKKINGFDGKLTISGPSITSLSGLDSIHTVEGNLAVGGTNISNFHALENLKEVGCDFFVTNNSALVSFEGLNNLQRISFAARIRDNDALLSFSGLDSLRVIGHSFKIKRNDALVNFEGLSVIDTIGRIEAHENLLFESFKGLESLSYIGGIDLKDNPSLVSIDEVGDKYIGGIDIENCDNLEHINTVQVYRNIRLYGNQRLKNYGPFPEIFTWNAVNEVEIRINDSLNCIEGLMGLKRVGPPSNSYYHSDLTISSNYHLFSMSGLDSLQYVNGELMVGNCKFENFYPLAKLDTVEFDRLALWGNRATTLDGLENLKYVGGSLNFSNEYLKNVDAISQNLKFVGSSFSCYAPVLDSISGFNQLNAGKGLSEFYIFNATQLKAIRGFNSVDSIGFMKIRNCSSLIEFEGFENLNHLGFSSPYSFNILEFYSNPVIENASGFCNLFTEGTIIGNVEIHDNSPGFNSISEITDWCYTPIDEDTPISTSDIIVYPNPVASEINVEVPVDLLKADLQITMIDISGRQVFSGKIKRSVTRFSVTNLPSGLYFLYVVFDGLGVGVHKIVVE